MEGTEEHLGHSTDVKVVMWARGAFLGSWLAAGYILFLLALYEPKK